MPASEGQTDWSLFDLPNSARTDGVVTDDPIKVPTPKRSPRQRPFFAGPVDMEWLAHAAKLPGAALQVALMLCHLGKLGRETWIPLSNAVMGSFGVSSDAKTRALEVLEQAKLIELKRHAGRSPRVRLIDALV